MAEEFSAQDERDSSPEEQQDSSSEEEQDVWTENENYVSGWHDRSCNLPTVYHFDGITICLNCCSIDADPATHDKARGIFNRIRQRTELRLLMVKGGKLDDDVHCQLVPCEIKKLPEYEAISYTWADESGDASKTKPIYLNGSPFRVTVNCEAALKQVRLRWRARMIWIDAVCIDQQNDEERGHQVRLMPQIYSGAQRVLIYLGEPTNEELKGLPYINGRDTPDQHVSRLYQSRADLWMLVRRALSSLLSRRYFSRVWILQEVALAKEALVLCGEYEVPWEYLRQMTESLRLTKSVYILTPLSDTSGSSHKAHFSVAPDGRATDPQGEVFNAKPLLDNSRPLPKVLEFSTRRYRDSSQLLPLLDLARDSEATDHRDKVFAVFGIINLAEHLGYVADYTEKVEETYTRVAVLVCETSGLMSILERALCSRNIQSLPSWVTDWSHPYLDERIKLINEVHGDLSPTILLDKQRYEIEFIGAQICHLEGLLQAGYCVKVALPGKGCDGELLVATMLQLKSLYRILNISLDDSLWVYVILQAQGHLTCSSVDNFEEKLALHSMKQVKKLDVLHDRLDAFILSSGQEFSFRGLCWLRPMGMQRKAIISRGGYIFFTPEEIAEEIAEERREVTEKWIEKAWKAVAEKEEALKRQDIVKERRNALKKMLEIGPNGLEVLEEQRKELETWWNDLNDWWKKLKVSWEELEVEFRALKVQLKALEELWKELEVRWNKPGALWKELEGEGLGIQWKELKAQWEELEPQWDKLQPQWGCWKVRGLEIRPLHVLDKDIQLMSLKQLRQQWKELGDWLEVLDKWWQVPLDRWWHLLAKRWVVLKNRWAVQEERKMHEKRREVLGQLEVENLVPERLRLKKA
jgi:hypothetical protein